MRFIHGSVLRNHSCKAWTIERTMIVQFCYKRLFNRILSTFQTFGDFPDFFLLLTFKLFLYGQRVCLDPFKLREFGSQFRIDSILVSVPHGLPHAFAPWIMRCSTLASVNKEYSHLMWAPASFRLFLLYGSLPSTGQFPYALIYTPLRAQAKDTLFGSSFFLMNYSYCLP